MVPATIEEIFNGGQIQFQGLTGQAILEMQGEILRRTHAKTSILPVLRDQRIVFTNDRALPQLLLEDAVNDWADTYRVSKDEFVAVYHQQPQCPQGYNGIIKGEHERVKTPNLPPLTGVERSLIELLQESPTEVSRVQEGLRGKGNNYDDVALIRETILERLQQGPANSSEIMGYLRAKELTPGTISNDLQVLRKKGLAKPRGKRSAAIWSLNKT